MSRSQATRLTFALLAIGFFATPIAARIAGVTAEPFENRRLAQAPKLSQGWDAFAQATRFITDRMPLRRQAVQANTRIWTDVFGSDPTYGKGPVLAGDQALPFAGAIRRDADRPDDTRRTGEIQVNPTASSGRDGWLYLEQEFEYACTKRLSDSAMIRRWAALVQVLRAQGHTSHMFVAPYKASIYPEHLPDEYPYDHCALEAKNEFWRTLGRLGPKLGVHGLRAELLRLKETAGDELFELVDTHWTTLGALVLIDAVVKAASDRVRVAAGEVVELGQVPYVGDLSAVSGRSDSATHMEYGIDRKPGAVRVPGRTLLLCDSFAFRWFHLFQPYFQDIEYVGLDDPAETIIEKVRKSDTVIIEVNELMMLEEPRIRKVGAIARALDATPR